MRYVYGIYIAMNESTHIYGYGMAYTRKYVTCIRYACEINFDARCIHIFVFVCINMYAVMYINTYFEISDT